MECLRKKKSEILSNEFKVAAQIYECNEKGDNVWFTKLAELLKDHISQSTVMKSLRTLFDWGIVTAQYGETDKKRAGRLLFISGESKETIRQIYEKFWKDTARA